MADKPCDWTPFRTAFPLKLRKLQNGIQLRPLSRNDLDGLCAFMTGDAEMTWTRKPWGRPNIEYLLNLRLEHYNSFGFGPYAVVSQGRLVGMAGLQVWSEAECSAEILVYIARSSWGNGIATTVVDWLIDQAKADGAIPQLFAATRPENERAIRMLQKLNFSEVGRGVHFGYPALEWRLQL